MARMKAFLGLVTFIPRGLAPFSRLSSRGVLCYYPDGSVARDFNFVPNPNASTKFAACCDLSEKDEFLEGGYCWFPSSPAHGPYPYRAACTDQSWTSPACPQLCTLDTPNRWESLIFCGKSSTFCCQKSAVNGGSCCDDPSLALSGLPKFPDNVMATLSANWAAVEATASASDAALSSTGKPIGNSTPLPSTTLSIVYTTSTSSPPARPTGSATPSTITPSSSSSFTETNTPSSTISSVSASPSPSKSTSGGLSDDGRNAMACTLGIGIPGLLIAGITLWFAHLGILNKRAYHVAMEQHILRPSEVARVVMDADAHGSRRKGPEGYA